MVQAGVGEELVLHQPLYSGKAHLEGTVAPKVALTQWGICVPTPEIYSGSVGQGAGVVRPFNPYVFPDPLYRKPGLPPGKCGKWLPALARGQLQTYWRPL